MTLVAPADQRVLAGSAATLKMTLYDQDGAPDTSGIVTVGVTRGNGSVLVDAGTATTAAGSARSATLTRAQTATTDRLTATWSIGSDVVARTTIDVVGGHWFTLAQLGARPGLRGVGNDQLIAVRDAWADLADRVTGVAWVERWASETFMSDGSHRIVTEWPQLRQLVSVTLDGEALAVSTWDVDLASGVLISSQTLPMHHEVQVIYRHGHDRPPAPLAEAGLEWCEWQLTKDASGISPRALGFSNEFGNVRYASANADHPTGLPDVDAMLMTYRRRIPGIA